MSELRERQLDAAAALKEAFNVPDRVPELCHTLFPSRTAVDSSADDRRMVDHFIEKVKRTAPSAARSMQAEVEVLRSSQTLRRPNALPNFVFKARKAGVFRDRATAPSVASSSNSSTPVAPSTKPSGSSSPFLRRSASRDPIHRDKIKDEPCSPSPLLPNNGTPLMQRARSRSNLRTNSTMDSSDRGVPFSHSYGGNSTEKPSSIVNPMYGNGGAYAPSNGYFGATPSSSKGLAKHEVHEGTGPSPSGFRHADPPPYRPRMATAPATSKPLRSRLGSPPVVDLSIMCQQMRGALQGVSGTYFCEVGHGQLCLSSTCSLDEDKMSIFLDLLSIANRFISLRRITMKPERSSMRSVLLLSISRSLEEYVTDMSEIKLKGSGLVQLAGLISGVEPWRERFDALDRCAATRELSDLVALDDIFQLWIGHRSTHTKSVLLSILSNMMDVFCNSLRRWLTRGSLNPEEHWMIGFDGRTHRLLHTPRFIDNKMAQYILKIGISQEFVETEKMDKYRAILENELTSRQLFDLAQRPRLAALLSSLSDLTGQSVVQRLLSEGRLMEHLRAARSYLLVGDACFATLLYQRFVSATGGLLRSTLSQSDATAAFVWAISQSPATRSFPFPIAIDTMASLNDSPNTSSRMQFVQPLRPIYRVQGVVAKVFDGTQQSYEALFHFIWSVQMAVFSVNTDDLKRLQPRFPKKSAVAGFLRRLLVISTRCYRMLLNVRQYILTTISSCTSHLKIRMESMTDMESATSAHRQFLADLHAGLFLDEKNETISALLATFLQLSSELSKLVVDFLKDCETDQETTSKSDELVTETLREFEQMEQAAATENRLIGSRRTKLTVMDASLTRASEEIHKLLLPVKENPGVPYLLGMKAGGSH